MGCVGVQIQVHDERGCLRPRNEYSGAKTGTDDDEMCISVKARAIPASITLAESILSDFKIFCQNGELAFQLPFQIGSGTASGRMFIVQML